MTMVFSGRLCWPTTATYPPPTENPTSSSASRSVDSRSLNLEPARITALARWLRSASTCLISMNGSDMVEPMVTMRLRSAAAAITPDANAAADGSAMSCTISPTVVVVPRTTAWAFALGE